MKIKSDFYLNYKGSPGEFFLLVDYEGFPSTWLCKDFDDVMKNANYFLDSFKNMGCRSLDDIKMYMIFSLGGDKAVFTENLIEEELPKKVKHDPETSLGDIALSPETLDAIGVYADAIVNFCMCVKNEDKRLHSGKMGKALSKLLLNIKIEKVKSRWNI